MTAEREAMNRLMARSDITIYAKDIAPICHMRPGTIIGKVKAGKWDQDRHGEYITSGNRVKFFRKDFIQKWEGRI